MKLRNFNQVKGNDFQLNLVQTLLKNKSFPHFSIFYGASGTGKSTSAEITALSLTCDNPVKKVTDSGLITESEPCLDCKVCRENLRGLENNQSTNYISKINMATLDKSDLKKQVERIFRLQPKLGKNCVYIFEEFQSLTKDEQTMFLEELSNISDDIYIIVCTTDIYRLIRDIRGRGTQFHIKVPDKKTCVEMIKEECKILGVKPLSKTISEYLVKAVYNNPREIKKVLYTLSEGEQLTDNGIREYLNAVSEDEYIEFFKLCKASTVEFMTFIDDLKSEKDINAFFKGMQEFIFNLTLFLYGGKKLIFSKEQKGILQSVFSDINEDKFYEILEFLGNLESCNTEQIPFKLLSLRRLFNKQEEKTIVKESVKKAKVDIIESQQKYLKKDTENAMVSTKITDESLLEILGDIKTVSIDELQSRK